MRSNINDKARENAKEIAKWLKTNFAGLQLKKTTIKAKFNLPANRSVMVFEFLQMYNIEVYHHYIRVPLEDSPSQEV